MTAPLNLAAFAALLRARGPDLGQWPSAEADAALDLMMISDAAAALFAAATQLAMAADGADPDAQWMAMLKEASRRDPRAV